MSILASSQASSQNLSLGGGGGGEGSAYLKNRDQIINPVEMIDYSSSEDTRVLGGQGECFPETFWNLRSWWWTIRFGGEGGMVTSTEHVFVQMNSLCMIFFVYMTFAGIFFGHNFGTILCI